MVNPFLVGQRVYLRPFQRDDAPLLVRSMNDPAVRGALGFERPITLEEEESFLARLAGNKELVLLGVVARDEDRLVGSTGLSAIQPSSRQAQFGVFIGGPEEWGKGYGTEATELMVGYGFETLNLNRIWLHVFEDNLRAIRVYEKVGFAREGLLRQAAFRDGRYLDEVSMAVLQEEWRRGHPRGARSAREVRETSAGVRGADHALRE
jgi:RimJ/RimL family protein N-acetyltransferase